MSIELKDLISRAKALPPEERALLQRELQELDHSAIENSSEEFAEDRFMQRLVDLGLLESARHPARDQHPPVQRPDGREGQGHGALRDRQGPERRRSEERRVGKECVP